MAIATLASILIKIRKLIGLPNPLQISDDTLQDYINSFYNYDLPSQFRSLKLKDKYTFNTIRGQDTYAFDSEHYTTVEMPCYCSKRAIQLFNDPSNFYGANFNWQSQTNFAFGDNTQGPFSGFTTAKPLLASVNNNPFTVQPNNFPAGRVQNLLITANTATSTVNVTDYDNSDGTGTLYVSTPPNDQPTSVPVTPVGNINYTTGQITNLNFPVVIPQGNIIQIQYNPLVLSIPLSILFFQNQFCLRPVPDQGYTIELIAYRQPSQAIDQYVSSGGFPNNTPELSEWWELIACGAAKKFFRDSQDNEGMASMENMLREHYSLAETRTYAQLGKQRIQTIFTDQLQYNYGSSGNGLFGI